jgi:hypothetical protein
MKSLSTIILLSIILLPCPSSEARPEPARKGKSQITFSSVCGLVTDCPLPDPVVLPGPLWNQKQLPVSDPTAVEALSKMRLGVVKLASHTLAANRSVYNTCNRAEIMNHQSAIYDTPIQESINTETIALIDQIGKRYSLDEGTACALYLQAASPWREMFLHGGCSPWHSSSIDYLFRRKALLKQRQDNSMHLSADSKPRQLQVP